MSYHYKSSSMGETDHEPTVFQNLSIPHKKNILSLSVDPSGRFTSCLGHNSLSIIDLEYPWEIYSSRRLPTKSELPITQWNPKENLIATTSNNDTIIWGFDEENASMLSLIQAHQNLVCDIAWSPFLPNLIATCSIDKYAYIWDLRMNNTLNKPSKVRTYCGWTQSITNVQWNRLDRHQFVVSQGNSIFIYDTRKEGQHLCKFASHNGDITSIDCSYHYKNHIITCSTEDKSIKIWDITSLTSPSCIYKLEGYSFEKVKYTPFKEYFVTSQYDSSLYLWNPFSDDKHFPFRTFQCHTNVLPAFDWRVCNIADRDEYQLVSWSDDSHLKLWTIDSTITNNNKPLDENINTEKLPPETDFHTSSQADTVKVSTAKENRVPSPRFCGARFVGPGILLTFGFKDKQTSSSKFEYPKTYEQYLDIYENQTMKNSKSNTIKQFFYSPNMIYFSSNTGSERIDSNDTTFPSNVYIPNPPPFIHKRTYEGLRYVNIYDVNFLSPIYYSLAQQYLIDGVSTSNVCEENAKFSKKLGRKDLVKLWTLLSYQTDPIVFNDANPLSNFDMPWASHPLGRSLVLSLIRYYEKQQDLQTLAMIVRVLSPSSYHSKQSSKSNENSLLTQDENEKYILYRKAYADILYRWGLYSKRSEILKNIPVNKNSSIRELKFGIICKRCNQYLEQPFCKNCNIVGLECSICHKSLKGNGSFCLICGHGGHSDHIKIWFSENMLCPTGCNCECNFEFNETN